MPNKKDKPNITPAMRKTFTDRAVARFNPNGAEDKKIGQVTRQDIREMLELYKDPDNEVENINDWLMEVPFVTSTQREKILSDLPSYWDELSYRKEP
jgi:hypothetical protein